MKIRLDQGEIQVAHLIASMRQESAKDPRHTDRQVDPGRTGLAIAMEGACAELAWHKWRNTYPDLSHALVVGSCDGIYLGRRVDIKATSNPTGRLICNMHKAPSNAEFFVLAVVSLPEIDFVGYAPREKLLSPKSIRDLGHGPVFCLDRADLYKFAEDRRDNFPM